MVLFKAISGFLSSTVYQRFIYGLGLQRSSARLAAALQL
jgi:hypothetical protein